VLKKKEVGYSRLIEDKKSILNLKNVDKKGGSQHTWKHRNKCNIFIKLNSKIVSTILDEKHREKLEKGNKNINLWGEMKAIGVSQIVSQSSFPTNQSYVLS
jgi:hypothetical protein